MTDASRCPKCQAPLPADAPAGICPKCLLAQGLETTVGVKTSVAELPQAGEPFGPYRLGGLLGSGGMGAVYVATHIESGRRVALKVLNHRLESTKHRQRFLREGRMAAAVNHPHSVYIFGTEEIDGTPAIAMELAPGGTLQDLVKRDGPLPTGEAVDVILQIIDGLEAAESAGVLHRDVKPSNCFLDADGSVKIGDFGLSISKSPRGETNLTETGVFLGTPAFSSPEQLRGDELDVRSDIYSVGVTLFYLLTGQTPFAAPQMVQLLATVLERPAPSPAEIRSDIPTGLAKVVQRTLAKRNSQRYGSYAELRDVLSPYASTAPSPGTLGFRALACGLDLLLLWLVGAMLPLLWARDLSTWNGHVNALLSGEPSRQPLIMLLGVCGMLLHGAYFTIWEGIWGTTAGKSMCGLRVVNTRREPPGLTRALLRTIGFFAPYCLPFWICFTVDAISSGQLYHELSLWLLGLAVAGQFSLFLTVRRRNGYAAVHEIASGTRVVRVARHQRRPVLSMSDESSIDEPVPATTNEETIGPYHVLGPLTPDPSQPFVLGYDKRLLRKVWIRSCGADAEPVPQHLRDVSRSGRLRWLNGQRKTGGGWDAYEAPTGMPLSQVIAQKQPWEAVRFWLLDLAEELEAGRNNMTLPAALELDRVWITADGRAKLLDFRAPTLFAPQADDDSAPEKNKGTADAALFLKQVAIAALEGSIVSAKETQAKDISIPMPVNARTLLNGLGRSDDGGLPTAELKTLTQQPAKVSEAKRVGVLAACFLVPLALAALGPMYSLSERQFLKAHPEAGEITGYVDYYLTLDERDERRAAVELIVAHRYRSIVTNPDVWSHPGMDGFVDADSRRLVEGFVASHPSPTSEQITAAQGQLAPTQWEIRELTWTADDPFYNTPVPVTIAAATTGIVIVGVIIPSFLCALLLGNSRLLRSLDIAIVTKTGAKASRWRVLWRVTVLWLIVLFALVVLVAIASMGRFRVSALLLVGWVVQTFLAERGLHDRLAGTWLVPR